MKRVIWHVERAAAGGLLIVYCVWNAYWLLQLRIPPSLFLAITGLPCPTTGGTRSLVCLSRGDWKESLRYNAMAIPISLLFFLNAAFAIRCLLTKRPVRLPQFFIYAWGAVLALAWVSKLLGNPHYW